MVYLSDFHDIIGSCFCRRENKVLLNIPVNLRFDPEKNKYWTILDWEGPYFQILKRSLQCSLEKLFYKQPYVLTSTKI